MGLNRILIRLLAQIYFFPILDGCCLPVRSLVILVKSPIRSLLPVAVGTVVQPVIEPPAASLFCGYPHGELLPC